MPKAYGSASGILRWPCFFVSQRARGDGYPVTSISHLVMAAHHPEFGLQVMPTALPEVTQGGYPGKADALRATIQTVDVCLSSNRRRLFAGPPVAKVPRPFAVTKRPPPLLLSLAVGCNLLAACFPWSTSPLRPAIGHLATPAPPRRDNGHSHMRSQGLLCRLAKWARATGAAHAPSGYVPHISTGLLN